jgi:hypothetical protein
VPSGLEEVYSPEEVPEVRLDAASQNDDDTKDIGRNNEYNVDQTSEMNLATGIKRSLSPR